MARISSIDAGNSDELFQDWWRYILIGFIFFSIILGISHQLYLFSYLFQDFIKRLKLTPKDTLNIREHFLKASPGFCSYHPKKPIKKPENFGVFLGKFDFPPTIDESLILSKWDLLIVDPTAPGILEAICSKLYAISPLIFARLDLRLIANQDILMQILTLTHWVKKNLILSSELSSCRACFTGVCISNWADSCTILFVKELIYFLNSIGFLIYLETSAPDYLSDLSLAELQEVNGIVIRNGTISRTGEEKDAFQMARMRPTIKAFVSQACLRSFVVLLWETIDDNHQSSNAVIRRCYQWSRFYNVLPWVGTRPTLFTVGLTCIQLEPLGAFEWLKKSKVMEIHKKWSSNQSIGLLYSNSKTVQIVKILSALSIPLDDLNCQARNLVRDGPLLTRKVCGQRSEISQYLYSMSRSNQNSDSTLKYPIDSEFYLFNCTSTLDFLDRHKLSILSSNSRYDNLGCFPLGTIVSLKDFNNTVELQRHLRKMQLLVEIGTSKLQDMGSKFQQFFDYLSNLNIQREMKWIKLVRILAQKLLNVAAELHHPIQIFVGLDSGFVCEKSHFWSVYEFDCDGTLIIYLSAEISRNMEEVILHTFLSSHNCHRQECFQSEFSFLEWSHSLIKPYNLPQRIINDVERLTPSELLSFLQYLSLDFIENRSDLISLIKTAVEKNLLDYTDVTQFKNLSTAGFLSKKVSVEDLINAKIKLYQQIGCQHPDQKMAVKMFYQTNISITKILKYRRSIELEKITDYLADLLDSDQFDARIDLICLSVFCAMKKHAFDETYLEVTDRNTLFNDQSDQAAAYAELFVTGARCEAYFDITPNVLGKLLSDRFRNHHHQNGHEPPLWTNKECNTSSTYAAAKIDVHPNANKRYLSPTQKFTFLSVFVIPALLDTLLLTTTGRGLYLSEYMTHTEQYAATLALMISLLISGAVGTWITCGGSYYLISMAFSAMNSFIVTRLIGGFAFTLAVGVIGFVALSITQDIVTGIIFFLYLIALTSYLCLLAALANFQYPGSHFQSGRPLILILIPFLLISPIISIWIPDHDILIYLAVFYIFLVLLVLSVRHLGSLWTTWLMKFQSIEDQDLRKWYIDKYLNGNEKVLGDITESGILKIARDAMMQDVISVNKRYWKSTSDRMVKVLAENYDASVFLMEWYSNYSQTPLPTPFSSTWNIQIRVALKTLKQLQTGIKLHNAFIHWRQAGDEVGCNILYFTVALLDKWNAILSGGEQLLGLLSPNNQFKVPVGFALAYYLIGAVFLDLNAAKLHTMITRNHNMLIRDYLSLPEALKCEVQARRLLYRKMLSRFCLFHVWSLAVSCSLLWIFQSTRESTIIFLAYVGAYSGLLWYQYTKIFSGPRSLNPLIAAVSIGISLGQILRHFFSKFIFSDVISLAVATWTAAILSFWFSQIKMKRPKLENYKISGTNLLNTRVSRDGVYCAFTESGKDPMLSQDELRDTFENMLRKECYHINPRAYPGKQVNSALLRSLEIFRNPRGEMINFALRAFPNATKLLNLAVSSLEQGNVIIYCLPKTAMTDDLTKLKAISYFQDDKIHIIFLYDVFNIQKNQSLIINFSKVAAEIVLHTVAENYMDMSHDDSLIAESLIIFEPLSYNSEQLNIPKWVDNYLRSPLHSSERTKSLTFFSEHQTLKYLSLGLDSDTQWESLPRDIRELIVERCLGHDSIPTKSQQNWLKSSHKIRLPTETYIIRYDFGAYMAIFKRVCSLAKGDQKASISYCYQDSTKLLDFVEMVPHSPNISIFRTIRHLSSTIYHKIGFYLKFVVISYVADPELQRELDYALRDSNKTVQVITLFLLIGIWNCSRRLQDTLVPFFILHGRSTVTKFWNHTGGTNVSLKNRKILLENIDSYSTAFILPKTRNGTFEVRMYSGNLDRAPNDNKRLQRISTYNYKTMELLRLEEFSESIRINTYRYEYCSKLLRRRKISKFTNDRYPIRRKCIAGRDEHEEINFNYQGLVESGSYIRHGNLIRFKCYYRKDSNYDDELLRADFVLSNIKCTVSWSVPPKNNPENLEKWIPLSQVMWAIYFIDSDVYESNWIYDHKFHPTICTTLNGRPVKTPKMIKLDYLGVLNKPMNCSFHHDDPLINFKSLRSNYFLRFLGLNTHQNRISTSSARSRLWNAWRNVHEFDGVIVRWLDERLLRKEPILQIYWRKRDYGNLRGAENFLNRNADSVMAAVDLDSSISGWAPLAVKIADLHSFGQGGDANRRTRTKNFNFDNDRLSVLAIDSGTWPNEGGGVSACRRDMINNLRRVNCLKIIPLWGLDFLTPTHGLFEDRLDTQVEHVPRDATKRDVKRNFLPILKTLVRGARTSNFTQSDFKQITRALVKLNTFFSGERHWGAVWTSTIVKEAWRKLWTYHGLVSPTPSENWFQTEIPTIEQLDISLELWFRYLFIFSIPLPEQIPAIFQASHHSVSAAYGIVCKFRRNCILQIWDHAISWREANLYLSSDLCSMAPFTRNALLGLMRLTSHLVLYHADIIIPCTDFFNPGWEIEIGTSQGSIQNRKKFKRKINPVVNGITDMTKFTSIDRINSEKPTVTMLSHVWYAKDIITSILAADIIVNKWGFKDYRLEVYGAIDKSPSYSMDCFELIASKSLSKFVFLCGESDPAIVLKKTWVFMNSSISEGLPLALGEAALTGAPVVCTDVGASLRVLTDPDTGELYSAVVAPNDPMNLAYAQINLLALLDDWAQYANDPDGFNVPTISDKPTEADIELITTRMYQKSEERKALGMRSRRIVQKSFAGSRYLREHEQMLWIGKARYDLNKRASINPRESVIDYIK